MGKDTRLEHEHEWIFDQAAQRLHETRTGGAIHRAMVAAHRDAHARAHGERTIDYHGHVGHRTDGEDRDLRRIDDRRELVDPEHAEIRDGRGRARVFLRRELALTRALRELAGLARDLADALAIRIGDDRRDQP